MCSGLCLFKFMKSILLVCLSRGFSFPICSFSPFYFVLHTMHHLSFWSLFVVLRNFEKIIWLKESFFLLRLNLITSTWTAVLLCLNDSVQWFTIYKYFTNWHLLNHSGFLLYQISGAKVTVHEPDPITNDRLIVISGTPDETQAAQSLLHAFILTGSSWQVWLEIFLDSFLNPSRKILYTKIQLGAVCVYSNRKGYLAS